MNPEELCDCPNPIEYEDTSELKHFLESLNLQQHNKALVSEGFETLEDLDNVQFEDLLAIGMKRGHARRLIKALEEYNAAPDLSFDQVNRLLQKRPSMQSHRKSLMIAAQQYPSHPSHPSMGSFQGMGIEDE